jgi:ubiquitin-protein ligase
MDLCLDNTLIQKNEENLMLVGSKAIRNRIKRELIDLYKIYNDIEVIIKDGELIVSISEVVDNQKQKYSFLITMNYPFEPPKIFYQNKRYLDYLKINYTRKDFILLKKVYGHECFCCHSFNCRDNWSPAVTLKKIIEEIYGIKKIKRNIINKICADIIKKKYLIEDIDLDSWLF